MTEPFLLIIPCLNEEKYIRNLVEDFVVNNKNLSGKIIIVDGGSTDKTADIAKELEELHENVHYLHNPGRIQSAAVNLAIKEYGDKFDYMIRVDAHADYPKDFCKVLLDEAKQTGAEAVAVSVDTVGEESFQKAVAAAQNSKLGNGGSAHRNMQKQGKWVEHGHNSLINIAAFKDVGGYDENFSHNEDAELDFRLTKAGYKIWLTPKTYMIYYPRSAPLPLFKQYFKFGEGRLKTILKHRVKPRFRQIIPVGVAPAVGMLLLTPFNNVFAWPAIIWALVCIAYGIKLAVDDHDNDKFLSGPAAMIMHFAWSLGFWKGLFDNFDTLKKQPS